jgi:hypothetical protein
MVLISHSHKFIFVKTQKTAGSSIEETFERYLFGLPSQEFSEDSPERITYDSYVSTKGVSSRGDFLNPHATCTDLRNLVGEQRFMDYTKAASVRNPWDQTVSYFWWRVREKHRLNSALSNAPMLAVKIYFTFWFQANRTRIREIAYTKRLQVDGIFSNILLIRYENLEEDLSKTLATLGMDPTKMRLPSRKSNQRLRPEPFQRYYFTFVRNALEKIRRRDLENFGYKWAQEAQNS